MNITFAKTNFLQSCPLYRDLPEDDILEIAVAGRSNAGKSTLINNLCRQNKLAKTSGVPGKTREMNLFALYEGKEVKARLVDLPGYGYAKANFAMQKQWQNELSRYLLERPNLKMLIVIMDSRHPLTDLDQMTINLAAKRSLRQLLIFNKVDKLNQSEKAKVRNIAGEAAYSWPNTQVLMHSSTKDIGRTELEQHINAELEQFSILHNEE